MQKNARGTTLWRAEGTSWFWISWLEAMLQAVHHLKTDKQKENDTGPRGMREAYKVTGLPR
jgi:hypothetical protein